MKSKSNSQCRRLLPACLALCGVVYGAAATASSCMEDVWKAHGNTQSLGCTANDVRIASAGNIRGVDGQPLTQCVSGTSFSFVADFTVVLNAQTRYDIGLYFATDGDPNKNGAVSGVCDANAITPPLTVNGVTYGSNKFIQLDGGGDACGDITAATSPQIITVRVDNVACQDSDNDGKLNLPNCTSWRAAGQNQLCTTAFDAYPGAPSKCGCDIGFNVPIFVEQGSIKVSKVVKNGTPASRPEPGGEFAWTVNVVNPSQVTSVTLERICDDQHGTVANATATACPAGALDSVTGTTCALPQTLLAGASYQCEFTANIQSAMPAAITNVVAVSGKDQNGVSVSGQDSAQVAITDVAPVASIVKALKKLECASVRYEVEVANASAAEAITLSMLTDSGFGNIAAVQGDVEATTCSMPQSIPASGTYECEFVARFCGGEHTNTVTGVLKDDENTQISRDSNALTVEVAAE